MTADVSGIVGQGNHWAVRPVRDPSFSEPEVVFMTYASKVVAFETMLPPVWFSRKAAYRNYSFAYKDTSALPPGWHPVQIQEEVVRAGKEMRITVLYDSFPLRCSQDAEKEAAVPKAPHSVAFKANGCQRELSFEFEHNEALPHGNAVSCSTKGLLFADGFPGSTQARVTEVDLLARLSEEDKKLLAATTGAPTHMTFDWMACGHPPGEWKSPHYDLHIFKVSKADRPPACVNGVGAGYVCKELDNPKYFEYGEASEQVLEGMTADVSGIVGQGNHWAVRPVRDPSFSEPEVVFMTYASKVVAFETMLPPVWFSRKAAYRNYSFAYKDTSALPPGWHPVQIQEEVVRAGKEMRITVLYDSFPLRCTYEDPSSGGSVLPCWISYIILCCCCLSQF